MTEKKEEKKDVTKSETATPPSPFFTEPFRRFRDEMDRFSEELFSGRFPTAWGRNFFERPFDLSGGFGNLALKTDVHESDKEITVKVELPGIEEKDVDLSIRDGMLTIKGEKRYESKEGEGEARVIERHYGSFHRSFTLPDTVDEAKVKAAFDKGVLTVTLPKTPGKAPKEHKIPITKL